MPFGNMLIAADGCCTLNRLTDEKVNRNLLHLLDLLIPSRFHHLDNLRAILQDTTAQWNAGKLVMDSSNSLAPATTDVNKHNPVRLSL